MEYILIIILVLVIFIAYSVHKYAVATKPTVHEPNEPEPREEPVKPNSDNEPSPIPGDKPAKRRVPRVKTEEKK